MRPNLRRLIVLSFALLAGIAGCGDDPGQAPEQDDVAYSFDLANYQPQGTPPVMQIANQTVAFPLGVGPLTQALSETASGELQRVYTRVGCQIDPEAWIGDQGAVPIRVPSVTPVRTIQVAVDHAASRFIFDSLDALAARTCVSIRSAGTWRSFHAPSRIVTTADSAHVEFTFDGAEADAAAIFLPTYTYLSTISYRIARD